MAFSLRELSRFGGKPIHLFRFTRRTLAWRFTSADREIELDGEVFAPAAITRSAIRDSVETTKNRVTITLPYLLDPNAGELPVTQSLGDTWRPYPPSDLIRVDCMAMHYGDAVAELEWTGRVIAPKFSDTLLTLTCDPSYNSGRRAGLQLKWQRSCPLALYSQGPGMCNVDPALHAVPATITGLTGLTLTAAAFGAIAAGKLAGGYFEWVRPDGLTDFRTIMAHVGSTILLNYGASDLAAVTAGTAYPGCAHNTTACEDDFDNSDNYGGAKDLPNKKVFDGMPVW